MFKKAHISYLQGLPKPNIIENLSDTSKEMRLITSFHQYSIYLKNVKHPYIHRSKTSLFLCATIRLCHYYTITHCFPAFPIYVDLCRYRSHYRRGWVRWVSMWNNKNERSDGNLRGVTLFCWRTVAKYCPPSSPIRLWLSLSVVSVYVKRKEWEIGWKGRDVTLFCWRAVARCCAPCGPIWLLPRLSVVSVYVKQKEWEIGCKR
jgi:hypothetical protein